MEKTKIFLVLLLFFLICSGCGTQIFSNQDKPQKSGEEAKANPQLAAEIQEITQSVKGISESTSVVVDKNISIAIKVKGFQRLRLDSIKKEVHSRVSAKVPKNYQIYLTSDKKLFKELQEIEQKIGKKNGNIPPYQAQKIKTINDEM